MTQPFGGGICPLHDVPYMPTSFPGGGQVIPSWHCPKCTQQEENDALVRSLDRDAVRDAVLTLAKDLLDGHADPADNVEAEADVAHLADVLEDLVLEYRNMRPIDAAEGIQLALLHIWTEWVQGER